MVKCCAALAAMAQVFALPAAAQGPVLSVQPTNTLQTLAGTGALGYSGDAAAATAATLATPAATAYDLAGNLYIADSNNHVIRKVDTTGTITTVAGSSVAGVGIEGFGGDGGPATSALLDTPMGVAVDASGNLYIADTHNQRIRRVNAAGVITTVAGNGTAGYSGDGSVPTSAELFLPQGVALDAAGNLYIADTGNERIRKVSGSIITTVAGNGLQMYSGDGGAATAAGLDTPTGVAADAFGNIFIADSHNQSIRMVSLAGKMSTVAGNGTLGYSGDSGNATSATLAKPTGVAVDASGNLYIADSNNNRIRQVSGVTSSTSTINTIAGNGSQGYGGDNGPALSATLNTPRSASLDLLGNVMIADSSNQRVRAMELPVLTFPSQATGTASAPQSITLSNQGSATLQVQTIILASNFSLTPGGTCPATPITLVAGASCTQAIVFTPAVSGTLHGFIFINGAGLTPQTILLQGTATQGATPPTGPNPPTDTFTLNLANNLGLTQFVHPGEKAVYTISVAPATGTRLLNAITFSVSGVPAGDTYTFNPVTLPAGGSLMTTVLTIQTAASTTAHNRNPNRSLPAPLALGLLLLPVAVTNKARRSLHRLQRCSRRMMILMLALVGLGATSILSGCGAPVNNLAKTSIQISTLTVTATSGGIQHSIPVTLIVN